jgi:hypothetical protein
VINGSAAGHTFVDGVCSCGRKFVDIQHYGAAEVGVEGITHIGKLTESEAASIGVLRAKMLVVYETAGVY